MMKKTWRRHLCAVAALAAMTPLAQAATWTKLTNAPSGTVELMLLLTDGTVLAHSQDLPGSVWRKLTPAANGSYANGTWTDVARMGTGRVYFASHVTPDGNVWVLGGEYSGPNLDATWINTGETYDTLANKWTPIKPHPESNYGDVPSMLLNGNKILAGSLSHTSTFLYDLKTKTWSTTGSKIYSDENSDEESWVKLPDGKVLTYDLFHSISSNGSYAEVYDSKTKKWTSRSPSDGGATGAIPLLSSQFLGYEVGAAMALRSDDGKGKMFFIGATGHTAFYEVGANNWKAGPDIMGTLNGKKVLFGADDAPAAVLPNGHVILTADAAPTQGPFEAPTQMFDFDPVANTINPVSPAFPQSMDFPAYLTHMLMLPNGQMMFSYGSRDVWIYTPDGDAPKKAKPLPQTLHYDGSGQFTLTGLRMNGNSAGSGYGDDAESDENYPIVSFTNGTTVRYARTFDWTSTFVQQKKASTVKLTLKGGTPAGVNKLIVSGAGVQSLPLCVTLTADQVAGTGAAADVPIVSCTQ